MQSVVPYLTVRDARAAIDYYAEAFGATARDMTLVAPDGVVAHAEVVIGDSHVFLAEPHDDGVGGAPPDLGGTAVRMVIETDDPDGMAAKAVELGAELLIPVAHQFYGCRAGRIRDPFGHVWIVSKMLEELTREEIEARTAALFGGS